MYNNDILLVTCKDSSYLEFFFFGNLTMIVFFTIIDSLSGVTFAEVALTSFKKNNTYDFVYYIYTDHILNVNLDDRFVFRSIKEVESRRYHVNYDGYSRPLFIFKFFELKKKHRDATICYISNTVICFKSLESILNIDDAIYGVKDVQNGLSTGGRVYARKCLAIRDEVYLSGSIIVSKGFHVYRDDFRKFLSECPVGLINPELDYINWKYRNSIHYFDSSVCSNYTYTGDAKYCYDYNTDITPLKITEYLNLVDVRTLLKIVSDFKYFKKVLYDIANCELDQIIAANESSINKCIDKLKHKDAFIRRYVLHCSD